MSNTAGQWLGWIGIILGIIGFFWQPIWMGAIALILGLIGLASPQKTLSWTSVAIGVIVLIVAMV